ncbi:MAG: GTP cyclohydrolase I FolE [Pseudomonadota bacterium]
MQKLIKEMLIKLGEDPKRHGLERTPERVEKSLKFLTKGYDEDPVKLIKSAIFNEKYDDMIIVKDIEVFSMCEHHMLPFFGKCHVAYIPKDKIIGLSKIPRLVEVFARRLQVQERLTHQIAHTLYDVLKPRGVGVIIEAKHMCMIMRGVEKQHSVATTSSMLGAFRKNLSTREEFLRLVQN